MDFDEQIKQFVTYDNQLKLLNDKMKDIREKRNLLSDSIMAYVEENDLTSSPIEISDGSIKYHTKKEQQPLTYKYLETALPQIIKNPEQVKMIIDFLKKNREVKTVSELKRFSKN
jgi:Family of unknown function (DUF5760)